MSKVRLHIYLPADTKSLLDVLRGDVSSSKYIRRLIEAKKKKNKRK